MFFCYSWFLGTFAWRSSDRLPGKWRFHPSPAPSNTRRLLRAVIISNMSLFEEEKKEQHGWVGELTFLEPHPLRTPLHTHWPRLSVSMIESENQQQRQREKLDPQLTRQAAVAMDTVNESLSSPLVWPCSAYRHGTERAPPSSFTTHTHFPQRLFHVAHLNTLCMQFIFYTFYPHNRINRSL